MSLSTDDVIAIQLLTARYNFAVDSCDGEAFAACFTPEGRFFNGDALLAEGHAALSAFAASLVERAPMRHVTTSILPDGDGATATCRMYCHLFSNSPERGFHLMIQGVYLDRLARMRGEWLFVERRFEADRNRQA